jgi:hypothetical protein
MCSARGEGKFAEQTVVTPDDLPIAKFNTAFYTQIDTSSKHVAIVTAFIDDKQKYQFELPTKALSLFCTKVL